MYKKKHPSDNNISPNKDLTTTPIIVAGLILEEDSGICAGSCGCDNGDGEGGSGGSGGRSNIVVHLYSSLLLISSNKISLSID